MGLLLEVSGEKEIPFIWFWPDGHAATVMMTHDVEGTIGAAHCKMLMDLDDSFSILAAFQLIPEGPYEPITELVNEIRGRGMKSISTIWTMMAVFMGMQLGSPNARRR